MYASSVREQEREMECEAANKKRNARAMKNKRLAHFRCVRCFFLLPLSSPPLFVCDKTERKIFVSFGGIIF